MTHTTTCSHAESPWPRLAPWWHLIRERWAAYLEAHRKAHEFDFATDLTPETLRDIGAPEYLISQARDRKESKQHRARNPTQWREG